jgi:hypothetical protein
MSKESFVEVVRVVGPAITKKDSNLGNLKDLKRDYY